MNPRNLFAELMRRNVHNDPHRDDPRFQKLVASPANSKP
jgi:hypothetical protein